MRAPFAFASPKSCVGAKSSHFEDRYRDTLEICGTRWGRKVVNLVHLSWRVYIAGHVLHELNVRRVHEMSYVLKRPCVQVVHADHAVAL